MRAVHWFRNDLRLRDNPALWAAAERADAVLPVFVLDDRLLRGPGAGGPRVRFLLDCLGRLAEELSESGCPLLLRRGRPEEQIPRLLRETRAELLCFNEDASPFARRRDRAVTRAAGKAGVRVLAAAGHVVHAADAVRTSSGGAYRVYTPYRKAWYQRLREDPPGRLRKPRLTPLPDPPRGDPLPPAGSLGLADGTPELPTGGEAAARRRLDAFLGGAASRYDEDRHRPDRDGTSRLSPYLRFGALSARACAALAQEVAREDPRAARSLHGWMDQLAWRDFYQAILSEHPRVLRHSFRSELDGVLWEDDEDGFQAWCEGRTGHPIVDAGMRQLAATGWMHNRVRMIVASFLTKDLLIDWRRGERFFFHRLVDGDPASNNGGWQWSASTGTDAQPWFRIFNPTRQGQRFDPEGDYVRAWVPELEGLAGKRVHTPWEAPLEAHHYPSPIVDHAQRRELALERFAAARARARP